MPVEVSEVKKARILITIAAEIPDTIGSKFFVIFICVFSLVELYTVMELKKQFIFFKGLPAEKVGNIIVAFNRKAYNKIFKLLKLFRKK